MIRLATLKATFALAVAVLLAPMAHAFNWAEMNTLHKDNWNPVTIMANASGTGTGFGLAGANGTITAVKLQINQAPTGMGGTSSTVTLTNNGSTVGSVTVPSATTPGAVIVLPVSANATVTPSSVLKIVTGAGLTTTSTVPGSLLLRATVAISATAY